MTSVFAGFLASKILTTLGRKVLGKLTELRLEDSKEYAQLKVLIRYGKKVDDPKLVHLMELGFSRESCVRALQKFPNDITSATEYLLSR